MHLRKLLTRSSLVSVFSFVLSFSLANCTFCPPQANLCAEILGAPLADLTDSSGPTAIPDFEEPGTAIAYYGFGCAESKRSGTEKVLKVEQSLDLPSYVTSATVFLNGWRLKYLSEDHHVTGLGTMIGNIRLDGHTLTWEAAGILSDKNFDDSYRWCYHYTVLGWSDLALNLFVDHDGDCNTQNPTLSNFYATENKNTTTALASFPSYIQNGRFRAGDKVAVLPRGFGFSWKYCDDHHLLQVGYNLVHSETFAENGKVYKKGTSDVGMVLPDMASQVDPAYVSWETSVIFKDDKGRRDYAFAEIASALGGKDVGVVQPPFSILPVEDEWGCTDIGESPVTQDYAIENVPFDFALPMLTGWSLSYGCEGDNHITEAGIWIDKWYYDKARHTLHYTISSRFQDKDGEPLYGRGHKVTILGLRSTAGGSPGGEGPIP